LYAKATVPVHQENKVCLWLGAQVMLEYPREEVRAMRGATQRRVSDLKSSRVPVSPGPEPYPQRHSCNRSSCACDCQAIELLERNLSEAKKTLKELIEDQGLLRDQITTTEVNMARVFNWDVKERRKLKGEES
jgi:hypothetical protein